MVCNQKVQTLSRLVVDFCSMPLACLHPTHIERPPLPQSHFSSCVDSPTAPRTCNFDNQTGSFVFKTFGPRNQLIFVRVKERPATNVFCLVKIGAGVVERRSTWRWRIHSTTVVFHRTALVTRGRMLKIKHVCGSLDDAAERQAMMNYPRASHCSSRNAG